MIKDNRNNEQIYGRNDMIMLDPNNKIYGSLGLADKYVMKTEEGTRLALNNPKQGKFGDVLTEFNLYGRSEQKKYKGINLIPPNTKYQDFVEVSIPKGTKVFAITDGTTTMSGNFHFFSADKTEDMWFGIDEGSTIVTTTLKIDAKYVQYLIKPVYDASKICLSIGNEPIYEPYVGGQPSPSPDYPQEIKSVVNPTVKVCGKNLWDNFKTLSLGNVEQKNGTYIATADTMQVDITSSSIGARPLLLKANNAYTFSLKTTVSISSPKFVCLRYTNGESNNIIFANKNFVNFVPERDVEKIGFILYESVAGDKAYDVQLEMGSEATAYEPYTEQSVQLPYTLNAIPVASGGNVTINGQQYIADYVDVERGKVIRNILKWRITDLKFGFNNTVWHINISGLGIDGSKLGLSNMFKIQNGRYNGVTTSELYIAVDGKAASLNMRGMTDEEFKKWLSEKNPEVYNVLTVAEEIPITIEEIEQYKKLSIKIPITIVENNYNTWMKATYKSIESV